MAWQGLHKSKYENGIFVKENKVKEMGKRKVIERDLSLIRVRGKQIHVSFAIHHKCR